MGLGLNMYLLLIMVLLATLMEGAPTPAAKSPKPAKAPKHVKCHDKKAYPVCAKRKDLYCPSACPRKCKVDCATCQPVCSLTPPPPPPPPPPPTTPTWSPPTPPKKVKCNIKKYASCYGYEHSCPSDCPAQCEVDCVTCKPVCNCNRPGAVCQDPRFIGGDGITFYFHGKKDSDFCIVSDSNLHINAHFIGRRNENMKRDFTWVQSLGILFGTHKLYIGAKRTSTWDNSIDRLALSFDGQPIHLPKAESATFQSETLTITRTRDTNAVVIQVEESFKIKAAVVPITEQDSRVHNYGITKEDCFAHLDLSFKFFSLSGEVDGVLGQTYRSNYVSRVKMGVAMPVLGGDKEFASSTVFATDCGVARFRGDDDIQEIIKMSDLENLDQYPNMDCGSVNGGSGIVCKK